MSSLTQIKSTLFSGCFLCVDFSLSFDFVLVELTVNTPVALWLNEDERVEIFHSLWEDTVDEDNN